MAPLTLKRKIEIAMGSAANQVAGLLVEVGESGDLERLLNEFDDTAVISARVIIHNKGGAGLNVGATAAYSLGKKQLESIPESVGGGTEDMFPDAAARPD